MENNLLQQKWMVREQKMVQAILLFLAVSFISAQDPPVLFQFNQSTLQAAYFFASVTIEGQAVESDDWVGAFNGDICVGARQWDTSQCGSGTCSINAMGNRSPTNSAICPIRTNMPAPIITPVPRDIDPIKESLLFLSVVSFIRKLFLYVINRRFWFKISNN